MTRFTRMCGICPWETPPQPTYDNAHSALWWHYITKHPYQPVRGGKQRRKP